jgi:glycosyltransferase involved in cell wall biosynthesis
MTLGTPVVASRIGGLAELTENNPGAIAVDPARSGEFVDAIRGIIGDTAKIAEMGKAAQQFVRREAYNERSADGLLAIYEQCIARRARSR